MPLEYEKLEIMSDEKGVVFEPLSGEFLSGQRNSHVVISLPGVVRGNHHHVKGEETVAVMGPALVRIREKGRVEDISIPEGETYRFSFPPGLPHAIQNLSPKPNLLVAFNTVEHNPKNPDTERDILV